MILVAKLLTGLIGVVYLAAVVWIVGADWRRARREIDRARRPQPLPRAEVRR